MAVLVPVVVVVAVAVRRFVDCNFVQLVFDLDFDCSTGRIDIVELDSQMVVLVLDNLMEMEKSISSMKCLNNYVIKVWLYLDAYRLVQLR